MVPKQKERVVYALDYNPDYPPASCLPLYVHKVMWLIDPLSYSWWQSDYDV